MVHFFDMRPYDPAKGRVALNTLKHLKKSDYSRVVPIHPLLIDLGLLDRIERLRAAGEVRRGKEVNRAFDYARKLPDINLTRANISLHATRHLIGRLEKADAGILTTIAAESNKAQNIRT